MKRSVSTVLAVVIAGAAVAGAANAAHAHGTAGDRVFPATLTIDDPAVEDEASLPTVAHSRNGFTDDGPASHQTDLNFEFDKRITERLGIGINDGYTIRDQIGDKSQQGWQNVNLSLKYQAYVNEPHEFMVAVGVTREIGGTGATNIGADRHGSTVPTVYFGKGLGDLPIGYFRPLAVTGTLGYQLPDQTNAEPNVLNTGLSLQYSLPYLQEHVADLGLPDAVGNLIPIVEYAGQTPLTGEGDAHAGTIAPGLIYVSDNYQLGLEALIPVTAATNTSVGVIGQVHIFFGDLLPKTLGKPLL